MLLLAAVIYFTVSSSSKNSLQASETPKTTPTPEAILRTEKEPDGTTALKAVIAEPAATNSTSSSLPLSEPFPPSNNNGDSSQGGSSTANSYRLPPEKMLPTRKLSLPDALKQAMAYNLDVQIKSLDVGIAADLNRQAVGEFNPTFKMDGTYEYLNRPQNTQDFISTGGTALVLDNSPRVFNEENFRIKAAIEGKLPIGTKYEVFSRIDILENTLTKTNPLAIYSPEYQNFTGVTLTQPLLKGFGTDVNLTEIRVARKNKLISELEFRSKTLETVATVLQSYYDLSYLSQELDLRRQERDLAFRLTSDKRDSLERGQSSSRDVNRAESALAETVEDLTQAKAAVLQRQAELLSLLADVTVSSTTSLVVPTTPLPDLAPASLDISALISEALMHRPEYLAARYKIERENIRLVFATNQTWPQLDLQSTAGYNGLTADFTSSYDEAIRHRQGYQWSVGVVFSVPIGNDTAIGAKNAAEKRKEQAILELKQVETTTALSIQQLVALYQAHTERFNAMKFFRSNAEKALGDEELRMEKGLSGDLDLLKFKRDLTDAKTRELAAKADQQKVLARLYQITGTLLEREHIVFANK